MTEVHAARAEEQQQRLLARELSHRMKNMFSVINAVVAMAGREDPKAAEVASKISGRVMALGRAHEATLVSASRTEPADLKPMMEGVLRAYDAADRVSFEGGEARLDSNVVSMVALTLHELAINAVKHGSLSNDQGRVEVAWRAVPRDDDEAGEKLILTWTERGGPPVERAPTSTGLGSGIVRGLIRAADGSIDFDWAREGVTATLCVPLAG